VGAPPAAAPPAAAAAPGGVEAQAVEPFASSPTEPEAAPRADGAGQSLRSPSGPAAPGPEAARPAAPGPESPARPLPERPAELPARLEVVVRDSAGDIRVAVTREDSGYGVEMRAPRELVPELRALRPALESALSGEGDAEQGLASFDASADDLPRDEQGEAADERGAAPGQDPLPPSRRPRTPAPPRPAPNPARLLDRRA
jgi:hypothetical protein